MNKIQNHIDPHKAISTCARCGKKISKGWRFLALAPKYGLTLTSMTKAVMRFRYFWQKAVNAKAPTDISQAKIKRAMILYLYFVVNNVEAR